MVLVGHLLLLEDEGRKRGVRVMERRAGEVEGEEGGGEPKSFNRMRIRWMRMRMMSRSLRRRLLGVRLWGERRRRKRMIGRGR